MSLLSFFFNDTATTEIYTLSLHDALPIARIQTVAVKLDEDPFGAAADRNRGISPKRQARERARTGGRQFPIFDPRDRKSTRLNSSHGYISYAVFCLKKKKKNYISLIPLCD